MQLSLLVSLWKRRTGNYEAFLCFLWNTCALGSLLWWQVFCNRFAFHIPGLWCFAKKRTLCCCCFASHKTHFSPIWNEIQHLTLFNFEKAAEEEKARRPFSMWSWNKSMCHSLTAIRAKVMGTDESCIKIGSYIWGMCIRKGPPSIWLTLNPADTHDPIAQVFCGNDINLDNFFNRITIIWTVWICLTLICLLCLFFFHFIVQTILETLFRY